MEGRPKIGLNRADFFAGFFLFVAGEAFIRAQPVSAFSSLAHWQDFEVISGLAFLCFILLFVAFRLKNAGQSPWIAVLCVFPPAFIGIILYCLFKAPQQSAQVASTPPKQKVGAIGLLAVTILVLGVLFGAIALWRILQG